MQRQPTEVRNSEQNTRRISVARTATPNKRKRSQTPEDRVRVNKLGSMITLPTKRQETATPIDSNHNRNKEVGNANYMQSTPSTTDQLALDIRNSVMPGRSPTQQGKSNALVRPHAAPVAPKDTVGITQISNPGIGALMRLTYDEVRKLSYDICSMTNTTDFPRDTLLDRSYVRLPNQLIWSIFGTKLDTDSLDWRKSRLQRAGCLAADRILCAMIHSVLLPGADRDRLPIKFLPDFRNLIRSVRGTVNTECKYCRQRCTTELIHQYPVSFLSEPPNISQCDFNTQKLQRHYRSRDSKAGLASDRPRRRAHAKWADFSPTRYT